MRPVITFIFAALLAAAAAFNSALADQLADIRAAGTLRAAVLARLRQVVRTDRLA